MQEKMNQIQKEMREIEKKYDGEERTKKIFEIYRKEKINPFFGIISLFFQFPILIALYQVFLKGIKEISGDPKFLYFIDLSKPSLFLVILVLLSQFFYSKYQTKKGEGQKESAALGLFQKQLNYVFLFFSFLILMKLPSAISLYLFINFLFLIFQAKIFHA
jgi:YidC/Oxa1 family membrane protein insertase